MISGPYFARKLCLNAVQSAPCSCPVSRRCGTSRARRTPGGLGSSDRTLHDELVAVEDAEVIPDLVCDHSLGQLGEVGVYCLERADHFVEAEAFEERLGSDKVADGNRSIVVVLNPEHPETGLFGHMSAVHDTFYRLVLMCITRQNRIILSKSGFRTV